MTFSLIGCITLEGEEEIAEGSDDFFADIPLVDLAWQHRQIADEVAASLADISSRCVFLDGAEVGLFEDELAAFSGAAHCISASNGTDALELALRAIGLPACSGIILPANSYIATAEAVVRAGCRPVLVDCDEHLLIDPSEVAARLGAETSAVIAVHLYGQMANMEALQQALEGRDVVVVEDAAQALGASRNGKSVGKWGLAAALSFYPAGSLGAYGDGGAVLTHDVNLASRIRLLARHGSVGKYIHDCVGLDSRLDTIQAAILRLKLVRLVSWNALRQQAAERYDDLLQPLEVAGLIELPKTARGNKHAWRSYVVRLDRRYAVLGHLRRAGIATAIHYPVPIHLQPAFRDLGHHLGDFPMAEQAASDVLSLPLYPGITEAMQARVAEALSEAVFRYSREVATRS